jgi:hypothetical protein
MHISSAHEKRDIADDPETAIDEPPSKQNAANRPGDKGKRDEATVDDITLNPDTRLADFTRGPPYFAGIDGSWNAKNIRMTKIIAPATDSKIPRTTYNR